MAQLRFSVGVEEKHDVLFTYDQVWGRVTLDVDGVTILRDTVVMSFRLVRTWNVVVGTGEMHNVRIEKHRPLLFSFLRPQPLFAYVDGVLVAQSHP